MRITRSLRSLLLIAASLSISGTVVPQKPRPDFNRAQQFDVQHYLIKTNFERASRTVLGDTTITLKPLLPGLSQVDLDAVDLAFKRVTLEPTGTELKYKAAKGIVSVDLDKSYGPEDTLSIRFTYTASPEKGIYFVPEGRDLKGNIAHSAQIWTQGEPDEARHWFPSFDFPSDKATTEQYITAQKNETVIANGVLKEKKENGDGTVTWHFLMPVPHSTYLVSFVIGEYVLVQDQHKSIPLGFYAYPGREATAKRAFGETKNMISVYEDLTGTLFPYNKYDQTIVAGFQFGGMENITATTMADTEIFFADFDFGKSVVTDLVSHELAHSWFGDLVTCKNWAELWLNEGFATFMEAAYRERVFGREDYLRKVRSDAAEFLVDDTFNKKRHPLYNIRADKVSQLFDNASTTYHKGGAVIHTLREQIGDEAFWKGIRSYLDRHRFGSVESSDLQKAMEVSSGQDLGWFFDQWVYSGGSPKLDVKQSYNASTHTLNVTVAQTQSADAITPLVFRLPLDLSFTAKDGEVTNRVVVSKRSQVFQFKVAGKPSKLEIDKDEKIPLKRVTIKPMTMSPALRSR